MKKINRRKFIKQSTFTTAAISAGQLTKAFEPTMRPQNAQYMGGFPAPPLERPRIAMIGVGARGSAHLKYLAKLGDCDIVAISDLFEDLAVRGANMCHEVGQGKNHQHIKTYHGGENEWRKMLKEVSPDVVFISTNWSNHAPMAIESMENDAHAFVEVPIALTIDEMWDIVNTSERTKRHCMMMENVNYNRDELMFLHMCRQGVIGELLHGEAAYLHELKWQMGEVKRGTGSWRTNHYANRNGNLYPTHGLGPIAQYMNLGRTEDTFKSLVSYSSPARGRSQYSKKEYPKGHQWNKLNFKGGDINTSIIKTYQGRTILVQWDETSPRPYSRLNLIQGTKGILAGFPTRVALEGGVDGITDDHHQWVEGDQLKMVYEKYDHPLYKRLNAKTKGSGHGGMDGMMLFRIIECLKNGWPLDQNVYEGCFWSSVAPLSEKSVAEDGAPQTFPDFTRGDWKNTIPLVYQ